MRKRCLHERDRYYHLYGGRGIGICPEWNNYASFLADMGEKPPGLSLDRIDNDGNYSKANCRWATLTEQGRNRRTTHFIEWNGERLCFLDWATRIGISTATLRHRLRSGWSIERSLTTPPIQHRARVCSCGKVCRDGGWSSHRRACPTLRAAIDNATAQGKGAE
jgi:hypothetical protein